MNRRLEHIESDDSQNKDISSLLADTGYIPGKSMSETQGHPAVDRDPRDSASAMDKPGSIGGSELHPFTNFEGSSINVADEGNEEVRDPRDSANAMDKPGSIGGSESYPFTNLEGSIDVADEGNEDVGDPRDSANAMDKPGSIGGSESYPFTNLEGSINVADEGDEE